MGAAVTLGLVLFACAIACSDRSPERAAASAPPSTASIESAIAEQLGARLGEPVAVRCPSPVACEARLADQRTLAVAVTATPTAYDWRVAGMVVRTDELEAYLRDEVAALGAAQAVRCAPRIRALVAGERVDCQLERGGKAFATVRADGTTSVEIELDPRAGEARSEFVSPERERALVKMSRDLDDRVPPDATRGGDE